LLLARDAYAFDAKKVIDAAIANNRVIELNANPQRLDLDWRLLGKACERGLLISINPDAHSVSGLDDVKFGVWMANKALVPHEQIINTWPLQKIESFLASQR
jgi:DNA polymerase (family 10)